MSISLLSDASASRADGATASPSSPSLASLPASAPSVPPRGAPSARERVLESRAPSSVLPIAQWQHVASFLSAADAASLDCVASVCPDSLTHPPAPPAAVASGRQRRSRSPVSPSPDGGASSVAAAAAAVVGDTGVAAAKPATHPNNAVNAAPVARTRTRPPSLYSLSPSPDENLSPSPSRSPQSVIIHPPAAAAAEEHSSDPAAPWRTSMGGEAETPTHSFLATHSQQEQEQEQEQEEDAQEASRLRTASRSGQAEADERREAAGQDEEHRRIRHSSGTHSSLPGAVGGSHSNSESPQLAKNPAARRSLGATPSSPSLRFADTVVAAMAAQQQQQRRLRSTVSMPGTTDSASGRSTSTTTGDSGTNGNGNGGGSGGGGVGGGIQVHRLSASNGTSGSSPRTDAWVDGMSSVMGSPAQHSMTSAPATAPTRALIPRQGSMSMLSLPGAVSTGSSPSPASSPSLPPPALSPSAARKLGLPRLDVTASFAEKGGPLTIVILGARNLRPPTAASASAPSVSLPDAYVSLTARWSHGKKFKTSVVKQSGHPMWNQKFTLQVPPAPVAAASSAAATGGLAAGEKGAAGSGEKQNGDTNGGSRPSSPKGGSSSGSGSFGAMMMTPSSSPPPPVRASVAPTAAAAAVAPGIASSSASLSSSSLAGSTPLQSPSTMISSSFAPSTTSFFSSTGPATTPAAAATTTVTAGSSRAVRFRVYHKESLFGKRFLGEVTLGLQELLDIAAGERDAWVPLREKTGQASAATDADPSNHASAAAPIDRGELHLIVTIDPQSFAATLRGLAAGNRGSVGNSANKKRASGGPLPAHMESSMLTAAEHSHSSRVSSLLGIHSSTTANGVMSTGSGVGGGGGGAGMPNASPSPPAHRASGLGGMFARRRSKSEAGGAFAVAAASVALSPTSSAGEAAEAADAPNQAGTLSPVQRVRSGDSATTRALRASVPIASLSPMHRSSHQAHPQPSPSRSPSSQSRRALSMDFSAHDTMVRRRSLLAPVPSGDTPEHSAVHTPRRGGSARQGGGTGSASRGPPSNESTPFATPQRPSSLLPSHYASSPPVAQAALHHRSSSNGPVVVDVPPRRGSALRLHISSSEAPSRSPSQSPKEDASSSGSRRGSPRGGRSPRRGRGQQQKQLERKMSHGRPHSPITLPPPAFGSSSAAAKDASSASPGSSSAANASAAGDPQTTSRSSGKLADVVVAAYTAAQAKEHASMGSGLRSHSASPPRVPFASSAAAERRRSSPLKPALIPPPSASLSQSTPSSTATTTTRNTTSAATAAAPPSTATMTTATTSTFPPAAPAVDDSSEAELALSELDDEFDDTILWSPEEQRRREGALRRQAHVMRSRALKAEEALRATDARMEKARAEQAAAVAAAVEAARRTKAEAAAQIAAAAAAPNKFESQARELERKLALQSAELKTLQSTLASTRASHAREVDSLKSKLLQAAAESAGFANYKKSSVLYVSSLRDAHEAQLMQLQSMNERLEATEASLREATEARVASKGRHRQRVAQLLEQVQQATSALASLQSRFDRLSSHARSLSAELSSSESARVQAQAELARQSEHYETLRRDLQSFHARSGVGVGLQLLGVLREVAQAQEELAALTRRRQEEQQRIDEMQRERREVEQLKQDHAALQQEHREQSIRLSDLSASHATLLELLLAEVSAKRGVAGDVAVETVRSMTEPQGSRRPDADATVVPMVLGRDDRETLPAAMGAPVPPAYPSMVAPPDSATLPVEGAPSITSAALPSSGAAVSATTLRALASDASWAQLALSSNHPATSPTHGAPLLLGSRSSLAPAASREFSPSPFLPVTFAAQR